MQPTFNYIVFTFKGMTLFVLGAMVWAYDRVTPATCLYTAVHGSYGLDLHMEKIIYITKKAKTSEVLVLGEGGGVNTVVQKNFCHSL